MKLKAHKTFITRTKRGHRGQLVKTGSEFVVDDEYGAQLVKKGFAEEIAGDAEVEIEPPPVAKPVKKAKKAAKKGDVEDAGPGNAPENTAVVVAPETADVPRTSSKKTGGRKASAGAAKPWQSSAADQASPKATPKGSARGGKAGKTAK